MKEKLIKQIVILFLAVLLIVSTGSEKWKNKAPIAGRVTGTVVRIEEPGTENQDAWRVYVDYDYEGSRHSNVFFKDSHSKNIYRIGDIIEDIPVDAGGNCLTDIRETNSDWNWIGLIVAAAAMMEITKGFRALRKQ